MAYKQTRLVGKKRIEVGTLVIDWQRKGIGRIKKNSGTDSISVKDRYVDLLDRLYSAGKVDALTALKDNKVTFTELFDWERNGIGTTPPWEQYGRPIEAYIQDYYLTGNSHKNNQALATRTISGYKNCFKQLLLHSRGKASLKDLPHLLKEYQNACIKKNIWRTYNQARTASLGLVRHATKSRSTTLYQNIKNIGLLQRPDITPAYENNPFSVNELDKAFAKKDIDERLRNTIWFLCLTGLGPKEYLEDGFSVKENIITIYGKKKTSRVRRVPVVFAGVIQEKWCAYRKLLKDFHAVFPDRTLYDCRRTFKTWCNEAGVSYLQSTIMMGHATSISHREAYGKVPERKWLGEVGQKLYRYIVEKQTTIDKPDIEMALIPQTPWEKKANIHNEKLKLFISLLDDSLRKWHDEGKMRKLYRVDGLTEIK